MKKNSLFLYLLVFQLCFLFHKSWATHIVGGEIQIRHLNGFNYEISLNLYFDDINGNPQAEDPNITVTFFGKSDNLQKGQAFLPKVMEQQVNYSNPNCSSSQLKTRLLIYRTNITLPSNIFNHPQGYYVIWERCCRNGTIDNIQNPGGAGMTFYTEIPPVVNTNGSQFINSTPAYKIPKGDYLCVNKPFTFDFGATDADGDQLLYSLETPINGNSRPSPDNLITPPPFPAPYQLVNWLPGFSANSAIPHNNSFPAHQFSVNSQTGLITVTPNKLGLYVFSVRVQEFRNGVKIGEVRRDYQLLVIDCPENNSPEVFLQNGTQNGSPIAYQEGQILTVDALANQLCFDMYVKDRNDNQNDRITVRVRGINFNATGQSFVTPNNGLVQGQDSIKLQFCWNKCLFSQKDNQGNHIPFEFELIVDDDGCPASNADTLRVKLVNPAVLDTPPTISTDASEDLSNAYDYREEVVVGGTFDFNVFAQDLVDNDQITLRAVGRGFNLAALGIQFEPKSGVGSLQSQFIWQTDCNVVKEDITEYIIDFITQDKGFCEDKTDTTTVVLVIKDTPISLEFLPANAFTPNNDNKNQVFKIPDLPEENCLNRFEKITIFNRWGGKVFESTDRNFEWDGGKSPTGEYYYEIDYKSTLFKGWISLLK